VLNSGNGRAPPTLPEGRAFEKAGCLKSLPTGGFRGGWREGLKK